MHIRTARNNLRMWAVSRYEQPAKLLSLPDEFPGGRSISALDDPELADMRDEVRDINFRYFNRLLELGILDDSRFQKALRAHYLVKDD